MRFWFAGGVSLVAGLALVSTTAGGSPASGSPKGERTAVASVATGPLIQQGAKLIGGGQSGEPGAGWSVALSEDGNTALVGGPFDDNRVGAAWVFTRSRSSWKQQGNKLTGTGERGQGLFGSSVALSADGNTALVGGPYDDNQVGAAWVFTRSGSTWRQQGAKLIRGGKRARGLLGWTVALSADGNTALIGGPVANKNAGAVWTFSRSGSTWREQGTKLTRGCGIAFGEAVALSADGKTALIGCRADHNTRGTAWVFTRSRSSWRQQGTKLTGTGERGLGEFGYGVALSRHGNTALIGGPYDDNKRGAVWVFIRSGSTWKQQGAKLTSDCKPGPVGFGASVALSADATTSLVGCPGDNYQVGAAWVFARSGSTWKQHGPKLTGSGQRGTPGAGASVALSAHGRTALIGGPQDDNKRGAVWVFVASP